MGNILGTFFGFQADMRLGVTMPAGARPPPPDGTSLDEGGEFTQVDDPTLRPPWVAAWEPSTNRVFYFNTELNEVLAPLGGAAVAAPHRGY
jgi:hypothetical protein